MQLIKYTITTLAPVILATRFGDSNIVCSLDHIPGSTILGLFAHRFIRLKGLKSKAHLDTDFFQLFLNRTISFGNAYICHEGDLGTQCLLPTPISIQEDTKTNHIYDVLLLDDDELTTRNKMKSVGGYSKFEEEYIYTYEVKNDIQFHHARDRKKGTAKEGSFFNYESLTENQLFSGEIYGNLESLNVLSDVCGREWNGYIGRSKNSQYGKINVKIGPPTEMTKPEKNSEVVLTFLSKTIILNEHGFPTTDVKDLEAHLKTKIAKAFVKTDDVETFVGIWKFNSPSQTCFREGSCFFLEDVGADTWKILEDAEIHGLGEKTDEGYGRCKINWQKEESLKHGKLSDFPTVSRPDTPIPDIAKKIVKKCIQAVLEEDVKLQAISDLELFRTSSGHSSRYNFPSNSLIGRLLSMSESMTRIEFVQALDGLRKTAKDRLENSRSREETMVDFLKRKNITAHNFRNIKGLEELCSEIHYSPIEDLEFLDRLQHQYFKVFFSLMRKLNKNEGKKDV